jgi:predicted alpha/beta-fold hydrolase
MHGFKDKFEYYRAGSPAGNLHKIKCPVFAFHSADDWVCPEHNIPKEEITQKGSNISLTLTDDGAHCCHFTGLSFWPEQYYPVPIMKFFNYL